MKKNLIITFFTIFTYGFSQNTNNTEIGTIHPSKATVSLENEKEALAKQIKINKIVGFAFVGLGTGAIIYGINIINTHKNDEEGVGKSIGIMFITAGGLHLGASVPFFIRASKKKKEKDSLENIYKQAN